MRIIAKFDKKDSVKFVSHLDVQRLFQRAFRRADIPMAYSQGFNPHPLLSFATALTVGATSSAEWLDIKLEKEMQPEVFLERLNSSLPQGFKVSEAYAADDRYSTLSTVMSAAEYDVVLTFESEESAANAPLSIKTLLAAPIVVLKKTKGGMKNVDIRPQVYELRAADVEGSECTFRILGCLNASGSLNIDLLMGALKALMDCEFSFKLHRNEIFSTDGKYMPLYMPAESAE